MIFSRSLFRPAAPFRSQSVNAPARLRITPQVKIPEFEATAPSRHLPAIASTAATSTVRRRSSTKAPIFGVTGATDMMNIRCQCGDIAFPTPTSAPMSVYHCHCTECRRQSSSAFGTSAIFPAKGLFPLSEELKSKLGCWTRPTKEGRTMDCYFCKSCGVRIMHRIREADGQERETVSVKGGVIEGLRWEGAKHIYTESAVVDIPPGAERWEATPDIVEGRPPGEENCD